MVKIYPYWLKLIIPQPEGFLILAHPVNSFFYHTKLFYVFLGKQVNIMVKEKIW